MDGKQYLQPIGARPRTPLPRWSWRVGLILLLAGLLWLSPLLTTVAYAQEPIVHVVKPGETLSSIARRYGVSLYRLAAYNGIRNPNLLRVGQQLRIPPSTSAVTPVASPRATVIPKPSARPVAPPPSRGSSRSTATPEPTQPTTPERGAPSNSSTSTPVFPRVTPTPEPSNTCIGQIRYQVQRYDTLWGISRRYGVSVSKIMKRNRLRSYRIYQGQVLIIPCP